MVAGTVRTIVGGKALVGGTVYDITFQGSGPSKEYVTLTVYLAIESWYEGGTVEVTWPEGSHTFTFPGSTSSETYDITTVAVGEEVIFTYTPSSGTSIQNFTGPNPRQNCETVSSTSNEVVIEITGGPTARAYMTVTEM